MLRSKRSLRAALAALALFLLTPVSGEAIGLFPPRCDCSIRYSSREGWDVRIDPQSIQAFQLDVAFDPTRAAFAGLTYVSPYVQTSAPDLSELSAGFVRDIGGISSVLVPPPGNVDIFSLRFTDLRPGEAPGAAIFSVFASSNDFLTILDTDTGQLVTVGGDGIEGGACAVPEPATMTLLGIGLAGAGAARWRRRIRKQEA